MTFDRCTDFLLFGRGTVLTDSRQSIPGVAFVRNRVFPGFGLGELRARKRFAGLAGQYCHLVLLVQKYRRRNQQELLFLVGSRKLSV